MHPSMVGGVGIEPTIQAFSILNYPMIHHFINTG